MHSGYFLIDLEKDETLSTGWLINSTIELLEDEIDIQSIEEIDIGYVSNIDGMANERTKDKFNEIIRVLKQIDKKIKEKYNMQTFNPDKVFVIKTNKKLGKVREIILNILGFNIYDLNDAKYIKFRHKDGSTYRVKVK